MPMYKYIPTIYARALTIEADNIDDACEKAHEHCMSIDPTDLIIYVTVDECDVEELDTGDEE